MKTIFIVEDQKANMKLIDGILKREGYKTIQAESADIGIPMIRQQLPDLILMDIHLPGTDGLTATRLLKKYKETCHIPIIAITARAMDGDKETILAAGCDAYAAKPIRYKEVLAMIETLIQGTPNAE
jgi:two-component system, cell cycle response regulator DivK